MVYASAIMNEIYNTIALHLLKTCSGPEKERCLSAEQSEQAVSVSNYWLLALQG